MSKIQNRLGDNMTIETLKTQLDNNPLEYRSKLTIPKNINFGLELELDKINFRETVRLIRTNFHESWKIKTDKSLTKDHNVEIVSPVLKNTQETWNYYKKWVNS